MKNNLLDLNLQFFAEEGAGAEVSEAAEPTETDASTEESSTSTEDNSSESSDSNVQSAEDNARFAAARRKAEAEFNQKLQAMDAEFANRFKDYENPITHQPIRSQKDYLDALDAQEKLKRDAELQSKGIDPKMFEDMVNRQVENNPLVQQAQAVMQQAQQSQIESSIAESMKVISGLNPNLKTVEDVMDLPNAQQMIGLVRSGLSLADAYKISNFDDLMAGKAAGAKQAALNSINGTAHLNSTDSLAGADDNEVEIPQNELAQWKRAFPHASAAELRKKYNSTL